MAGDDLVHYHSVNNLSDKGVNCALLKDILIFNIVLNVLTNFFLNETLH